MSVQRLPVPHPLLHLEEVHQLVGVVARGQVDHVQRQRVVAEAARLDARVGADETELCNFWFNLQLK